MSRQKLETIWDLFMLLLAAVNLLLILFDLTYISLRPKYLKYAPAVVRWYDPYKGIEPHWTTDTYRQIADSLVKLWNPAAPLPPEKLQAFGDTLFQLSVKILTERPYERFGLMAYQELLKNKIKTFIQEHYGERLRATAAFHRFWTLTPTNAALHLDFYRKELRYLLQVNYYRHYDLSGDYVDHFWKLDLPFLVFFWIEFWIAWWVSLRTRRYAYWWMYPLAHWYDVLALIPLKSLRWFRLLRIWNLYLRLNRSKFINFSNTIIARFLTQQSRLIAKAISDEVAYQILEQVKRQIKAQETLAQSAGILEEVRPLARHLIAGEAGPMIGLLRRNPALAQMIEESLMQALERELPTLPGLPRERLLTIARKAARQTTERFLMHLEAYLRSEAGQKALATLTDSVLTHLRERLQDPTLQEALQNTLLAILSHLQRTFRPSLPASGPPTAP
ncbi:MAG: hypothetical protein N3A68_08630 [Bacteroidia bacterium]|jgi:hypothetical protein|nr:hypothetical protein [Bacteroidia bacterium]GIV22422.1 MAG: hypothetical protein KatS3mg025_0081 [Bacteroidia bacterium]